MQSRIEKYELKIRDVLEKLVHPSGHVNNEFQLESLIKVLKQQNFEGVLKLPVFHQWLVYAVNLWWTNEINPPVHILCFTLELAHILTKNEEIFNYFHQADFFSKIVKLCRVYKLGFSTDIKQSYIKFLGSLLDHESGFKLLVFYNLWEEFFYSSELTVEGLAAIARFLEKMLDYDAKFCTEIVQKILAPLMTHSHRAILCSSDPEEIKTAGVPLKRLGDILEYIIETKFLQQNDTRLLKIFSKNFNVQECLSDLLVTTQNQNLTFDLCKIVFIMQFFDIYFQTTAENYFLEMHKDVVDSIMHNYIQSTIRANPDDILKFSNFSHLYCRTLGKQYPSEDILNFGSRFVMLSLQPSLVFTMKNCFIHKDIIDVQSSEISQIFQKKVIRISGEQILRHLINWKDFLFTCPFLLELCEASLLQVRLSRKHYSKQAAIITFEVLLYTIKGIVRGLQKKSELLQAFYHRSEFYCLIFENLSIVIEEFGITWKDTIESVDLLSLTLDFLNEFCWSSEVVAAGLKVVNLIIAKYMAPNLALLMDVKVDPNIQLLGSILIQKLQNSDDCVKQNALKIVSSLVQVSGKKFPSLQNFLTDLGMLDLVAKSLIMDSSESIKINSIKCLEEIVKVRDLAPQLLKIDLLVQKCEDILLNNSEAILRTQAARFLAAAYEHNQLTKQCNLNQVFVTMVLVVTNDLDWRVKISALDFWKKVIEANLFNQGMVDGSFPEVEFSKQKRKIISLTKTEVQKRLFIVLDELSLVGCLEVLSSVIKKDYDNAVRIVALKILNNLKTLLKQYDVKNKPKKKSVNASESLDYDEMIISNVCWTKNDVQTEKYMSSDSFLEFIENGLHFGNSCQYLNAVEDFEHILDSLLKV